MSEYWPSGQGAFDTVETLTIMNLIITHIIRCAGAFRLATSTVSTHTKGPADFVVHETIKQNQDRDIQRNHFTSTPGNLYRNRVIDQNQAHFSDEQVEFAIQDRTRTASRRLL